MTTTSNRTTRAWNAILQSPARYFFRRRGKKIGGALRCGACCRGLSWRRAILQWGSRDHQIRLDSLEFGAREWLVGNAGFSANGWKGNV
ncbi:hypothetical protein EMPG_14733, partial [Blastomyces silverae]